MFLEEFMMLLIRQIQQEHQLWCIIELWKKKHVGISLGSERSLLLEKIKTKKKGKYHSAYHVVQLGVRLLTSSGVSNSCWTHCGER